MPIKLPKLSSKTSLHGKRIVLRVDWNTSLASVLSGEDSLKFERSYPTIHDLASRGAIVLILTHLGRPKGHELRHSTKRLVPFVQSALKIPVSFLGDALDEVKGREKIKQRLEVASPGSVFILENARFLKGEETNSVTLARAVASLVDVFINDAFGVSHRNHALVAGITRFLPSYAGPALCAEVDGLEPLLRAPKKPFIAIVGGAKLSTKEKTLTALLQIASRVLVGGAMAHPFFIASKHEIGKSYIEKSSLALAKKLLKHPKLVLPTDVLVSRSIKDGKGAHVVGLTEVKKTDMIVDIGTDTMRRWASEIKTAKTVIWNGPMGMAEVSAFSHGSRVIARMIAARSKGSCFGVVGGGDTLPIMFQSGMSEWIDHLSTGGGAMLEFIAKKGKLPGLEALKRTRRKP